MISIGIMGKKSAAQLRRLEKRAAKRGEKYIPPVEIPSTNDAEKDNNIVDKESDSIPNTTNDTSIENMNHKVKTIALRLQRELLEIAANSDLASKDRRSAKRKAEAIAAEDSGIASTELLKLIEVNRSDLTEEPKLDAKTNSRIEAGRKLVRELKSIDDNEDLKSKDRRSAKRKAEAISFEETGMAVNELLEWYEKNKNKNNNINADKGDSKRSQRRRDPLIAFVGQLSYETTTDEILAHICSNLSDDYPASKISKMTKIRLLTDPKTHKSRGMAFVEVDDPEFLYALLKLHQTYLKGRRINIEKSAGGRKQSDARKSKIDHYRKEQNAYFAEVVESILAEYKKTGELREDELDEGVITVCKHHAGPVVQAALAEYVEKGGRDMNNPSAYLTFLVTKFAKEGIHDVEDTGKTKIKSESNGKRNNSYGSKEDEDTKRVKRWNGSSEFDKSGVDMSLSQQGSGSTKSTSGDKKALSKIFPSSQRGRGRGYMRNVRR